MPKLFISHTTADDAFVRELRQALADLEQEVWIDSRELRGGDPLWPVIQQAIEGADAFLVLISSASYESEWVGDELAHAIEWQKRPGNEKYRVIPALLDGAKLGVFKRFFAATPTFLRVDSAPGGVEAAVNDLLEALGQRLGADVEPTPQPQAEPLEELVLELGDLKIEEQDGKRRAAAHARLVYVPATAGQPEVLSARKWNFVAPLGPIEKEDLRWYLEQYATWPSGVAVIQDRARKVERDLVAWGKQLHEVAMPATHTANVLQAWAKVGEFAGRRFSVQVDDAPVDGAPEADVLAAKEAATALLGLPWELLHDSKSFLFQGARPTRVRRRIPGTESLSVPVVATPIRILLVTARPEDDSCGYIDHRASALPLVEAMESLPGLVEIHLLRPPTLPALREELDRARELRTPYHVVHFDGHGVYDKRVGLGGLCFEHPEDVGKLEKRRHVTIYTKDSTAHGTGLESLLRDHRIPLVVLEACQTALAEKASESVASELLKVGVASVVAMSHSVLVATSRRFVQAFYQALAAGKRVGDAMLAGQRRLKDDTGRGRIFGVGELHLEDWFVPVLYQEKEDPQLFKTTPAKQTVEDFKAALQARLGDLPDPPATGFIGRSKELLALERLLRQEPYAVVRGQGGEGKTALAAELARWMVRSHQIRRAAFVSVETHGHRSAVVDALGRQLVGKDYSVATFDDLDKALLPLERSLTERSTLLVVDNLESILLPPYLETPEALSEEAGRELTAILALCQRLLKVGDTRLVFTSREALPAPFDGERYRRELHRLDREDAVKLVERALNADQGSGTAPDAAREAIEELVDAVHCHARTLALLAPALRRDGVERTKAQLVDLMAGMEKQFPGSREHSLFASVELSLRRLSPENRERVGVLGVFHGGVSLTVLSLMMEWEVEDVAALAGELIETGLATPNRYNHLTLNPALCPYLRGRMDATEHEALTARWVGAMGSFVEFLVQEQNQNTQMAATLTGSELPNLFALLDRVQGAGDAESTIDLATSLYRLLRFSGKPRLVDRVGQGRDAAEKRLGEELGGGWNHARFEAARTRIEQQLAGGKLREAFEGAQQLLQRARAAGESAYPDADYDLALACILLARVLRTAGGSEQALPLLDEARRRFEAMTNAVGNKAAERMASACITEQGNCLRNLGRLDEAAAAYEEGIRRGELLGDDREVAVGKGQLGTVRMLQRRYPKALAAYSQARERFTQLDEPGTVAGIWHQTGMVCQEAGQPEAAEDAYRKSLAINVRLGDVAGQAKTLNQLGILYDDYLGRTEEAVAFLHQAADKAVEIRDVAEEGRNRNNLAIRLRKLRRLNEARQEIHRAIECKAPFGHASEPWTSWSILADIETDAGNAAAAVEARGKAVAAYLAYRRDGGENHNPDGRLCLSLTQFLLAGDPGQAGAFLAQVAAEPEAAWLLPFVHALQTIVAGSRDRALAEAPELDYTMAAEILLLIETLEARGL